MRNWLNLRAVLACVAIGLLAGCAGGGPLKGPSPEQIVEVQDNNISDEAFRNGVPRITSTAYSTTVRVCPPNNADGDTRTVLERVTIRGERWSDPDIHQAQTLQADANCDTGEDKSGRVQHMGVEQQVFVTSQKGTQQVVNNATDIVESWIFGALAADKNKGGAGSILTVTNDVNAEGNSEFNSNDLPPPPSTGGCAIPGTAPNCPQ